MTVMICDTESVIDIPVSVQPALAFWSDRSILEPMPVRKIAISLDPDLYEVAKAQADREGTSMSAWLAEAAKDRLRQQALGAC